MLRDGGWGYLIRAMSVKEVSDLFKIRELLELLAALECKASADEVTLADLSRTLEEASASLKAGNAIRARELNRQFQFKLARSTGNALLQQLLFTLNDRIWWVGSLHHRVRPARVAESLKENHRILAEIFLVARPATCARLYLLTLGIHAPVWPFMERPISRRISEGHDMPS